MQACMGIREYEGDERGMRGGDERGGYQRGAGTRDVSRTLTGQACPKHIHRMPGDTELVTREINYSARHDRCVLRKGTISMS